jgi:hypothetical protein
MEPKKEPGLLARIEREIQSPGLLEALTDRLPGSDLQSLLVHVTAERAERVSVAEVLSRREQIRATSPDDLDQRVSLELDRAIYQAIPTEFVGVDLAPVNPLGSHRVLSGIDAKTVSATVRGTEVLADPTVALALECALRRRTLLRAKATSSERVSLCTSARVLRLQHLAQPWYTPHFRIFALCTAGRDTGSESFECEALLEHLRTLLRILDSVAGLGYRSSAPEIWISSPDVVRAIERVHNVDPNEVRAGIRDEKYNLFERHQVPLPTKIEHERELSPHVSRYGLEATVRLFGRVREAAFEPLKHEWPTLRIGFDLSRITGSGYYQPLSFSLYVQNPAGQRLNLGDGGLVDWTQRLLGSQKERLFTSGLGTGVLPKLFRATEKAPGG